MLEFRKIDISDKQWIEELLSYSDFRGTEYSFVTLFIWADVLKSLIGRWKDWVLLRFVDDKYAKYIYPAGRGSGEDFKELLSLMEADAKDLGLEFRLVGITNETKSKLEAVMGDRYSFEEYRDGFDYIYEAENLMTLTGKKYQSKRNHIARFKELPNWKYESINSEKIDECIEMNRIWCQKNGCQEDPSKKEEACAVRSALSNFNELGLVGGILRLDDEIVAYTIGEKLNSDTFIVHIEKAFGEIQGAYPAINQEFLLHEATEFKYINREDDAGNEGLRKAKLSYKPAFLLEKHYAQIKTK